MNKTRKITVRLDLEEWQLIRDEAGRKRKDMGPLVKEWIDRKIAALRAAADAKSGAANKAA